MLTIVQFGERGTVKDPHVVDYLKQSARKDTQF